MKRRTQERRMGHQTAAERTSAASRGKRASADNFAQQGRKKDALNNGEVRRLYEERHGSQCDQGKEGTSVDTSTYPLDRGRELAKH